MSAPLWQPRSDFAARLLGAGFFVGGGALVGYQVKVILEAVAAHADRVNYFMSAFALGAMAVGFGGYWLVRGLAGYAAVRSLQTDPRRMRIFMGGAAAVMIVLLVGVKAWLSALGYDE